MNLSQGQEEKNRKMSIWLENKFNFIVLIIILFILIISYFALIKPKYNFILSSLKDNIIQQEKLYLSQEQRLKNMQSSIALYYKLNDKDLARIELILPDKYAKEKLYGDLEDLSSQLGLSINSLNLKDLAITDAAPRADERAKALPDNLGIIEIELELANTDYIALKSFLRLLESNIQLFDIVSINFGDSGDDASLVIHTYYFK